MTSVTQDDLVLVTGASGFIASHVVKQLQEQGYKVRGTVRSLQNKTRVELLQKLCPNPKHPLELVEADLLKPDTWANAVSGCKAVLHIASPFPPGEPQHEDEVIKPAVDGTLSVLHAAHDAGVSRVVLTSSVASVSGLGENGRTYTEADWTDEKSNVGAYFKSKTIAERAAWDYWRGLEESKRFELATINPSYVMGPALHGSQCTSMLVLQKMLQKEIPLLPKLHFNTVDVRDVAEAHIKAMIVPEAAGHRHIVSGKGAWMREIAETLNSEFKPQGYSVTTTYCPKPLLIINSWFDKSVKLITPMVNIEQHLDTTRMKTVLGVKNHEFRETVIDMAYNLIDNGFVKKSTKYKPRE